MADCTSVPFCQPYDPSFRLPEGTRLNCDDAGPDPFRHHVPENFGGIAVLGNEERFNAAKLDILGIRRPVLTLQDHAEVSNLETNIYDFVSRGGSYYVAPLLTSDFEAKEPFKIHFYKGDVLIPVCHQGMNRSQVMYLALQATAKRCGIERDVCISRVHGAETGFDPYQRWTGVNDDNATEYMADIFLPRTAPGEWLHENFFNVFYQESFLYLHAC